MLREMFKVDKSYMLMSLAAIPVGVINPLIDIYFLNIFLKSISEDKSIAKAALILGVMFALNLINLLWDGYICNIYMPIHEKKIAFAFKSRFIEAARRFEAEKFEDPRFYDEFVISSGEANSRPISIWKSCVGAASLSASVGTIITLIISTDLYLIIFAVISAVIGLIPQMIKVKTNFEYNRQNASLSREEDYFNRIIYNKSFIFDLKCTDIIEVLKNKLADCLERSVVLKKKYSIKNMKAESFHSLISVVFTVVTWLYIGVRIVFGYYTIAAFTAMFNACNNFRSKVRNFVEVFSEFKDHRLYADKVYDFLDYKPPNVVETGITKEFEERIELSGVSYIYPNTTAKALDNVNLIISKGEKIAIVGQNGAGKSTLIKILLRLYEPCEGLVTMDGVPYRDIKESSIKKTFSCCFQDFSLYSFSLGENISMSNEYDAEEIGKLLEKVNMNEYKEFLANQVNRDFDEEGLNFSGGEAQRIGIIRALYQNGDILVFDEANSSLDPIAEKELNDLIYDISGDKTAIFISHRLSAATKADRIVYMEEGSIIESGTHRELLCRNGRYAKLYNAQIEQLTEKVKTNSAAM